MCIQSTSNMLTLPLLQPWGLLRWWVPRCKRRVVCRQECCCLGTTTSPAKHGVAAQHALAHLQVIGFDAKALYLVKVL